MAKIRCCKCWREGVPPVWLVCIGLLIVQLGFGIYPVVVKKFANSPDSKANPLVLSFYRDLCCFPVLFLCAFIAERKVMIPSLGMLILFILFGLIGMFGNQYLFILGLYNAGPVIASVFQPIIPVWTTVLAIVSCTEKLSSPRKIPIWAKLLGILLAAGNSSNSTNDGSAIAGYLFLFGNTICMAIYVLLQKRFIFSKPQNKWRDYPVSVTAYSYFFGAIFMGLCSLQYVTTPENRALFTIPWQSIYVLIYATFITSALCYLLITWANSQVSSILVTASWPLQVLFSTLLSYFFLNIEFGNFQYIGAVMLICGLFFVLWSNYQEEREKEGKGGFIGSLSLDCGRLGDGDSLDCMRSGDSREKDSEYEKAPLVDSYNKTPSPDHYPQIEESNKSIKSQTSINVDSSINSGVLKK